MTFANSSTNQKNWGGGEWGGWWKDGEGGQQSGEGGGRGGSSSKSNMNSQRIACDGTHRMKFPKNPKSQIFFKISSICPDIETYRLNLPKG